jgi:hypothetical protein
MSMNNMGSRRSLVSSNHEEGNNKGTAPSVHSSDETVVRRGDGKFKKKDPKRIAHGIMNFNHHAYTISSFFRRGRSGTESARQIQSSSQQYKKRTMVSSVVVIGSGDGRGKTNCDGYDV